MNEHARLKMFLNYKFDALGKNSLMSWNKSIREYVIDWVDEFYASPVTAELSIDGEKI